jgi:hypothetical protein
VQVGGSAVVGGTLAVSSLNNFRPVSGNAFEVLHSNGTRSGQFAQINDSLNNNPSLQRIDVYAPNGVALVYFTAPPTPTPSPAPEPPPIPDVIPDPLPPVNPDGPLFLSFLLRVLNPTAEQLTSLFEIPFSGANTQRLIWMIALRRSKGDRRGLCRRFQPFQLPVRKPFPKKMEKQ